MARESFSCKHYFILIPYFYKEPCYIYKESDATMRKRKIVGSYRFVSKMKTQMAHSIQRMYSFLFTSKKKKKLNKRSQVWPGAQELCSSVDQDWMGI